MDDVVTTLQELGFSEYEARAYVALLQRSPLNGYELAKQSGLPRANVYAVLAKLEERGAALRLDTPQGVRYAPIAPDELAGRLSSRFQDSLAAARNSLQAISRPPEYEVVLNTREYPALLEHARALLAAAQRQLQIAIWPQEARALAEDLARAEARGVEVNTLCLAACPQECGGCRGHVHRYQVAPEGEKHWLVLVPDGAEVLAGEIGPDGAALAVRTRQRLLVELAVWYMRHSIALAAMLSDLGGRLEGLLRPETQATLATLGPGQADGGWLKHLVRLLGRAGTEQPGND
jgi:DNA-binding MarR family transcriptional regulator